MTIRTTSPKNYLSPSRQEMRDMADQVGLKNFSPSLVEDICNVIAGGDFRLPSEMIPLLKEQVELSSDRDGDLEFQGKLLRDENGKYIKDESLGKQIAAQEAVEYHERVQDFLRSLDLDVPGSSPLEQAMNILKILSSSEGGIPGGDGDTLPIFTENSPEDVARRLNEAVDAAESLDEIEQDLLNPDGGKSTVEIAQDMMSGKNIMLKIKRELDKLVKLRTSKSIKLSPDPEGNEVRYRGIKELSEIDKLNPAEFAYPQRYRNYRMITGAAQVRERCTREEKKMLLYVLCDCSGSMKDDQRFWKAGGVLMNRLKAVVNGEAELFFSFFDESLKDEQSAVNADQAKGLIRRIQRDNFSGGGTAITKCAKEAVERIIEKLDNNPALTKPELVVITDGDDDTSSFTLYDLHGIRLHTFVVGGKNDHIVNLAQKSGGVGIANL